MADFPENEIQILDDDYVSQAFMDAVRAGFATDGIVTTDSFQNFGPKTSRDQLERMSRARKRLLRAFVDPSVLDRRDRLRVIRGAIARGDAVTAQQQLTELIEAPALASTLDLTSAFNRSPVRFFRIEFEDNPVADKPPIRKEGPGTIDAYTGEKPSDEPGQRLVAWISFLSKGPKFRFQKDLLQAEIDIAARNFGEAAGLYDSCSTATPAGSLRRKFVAHRCAFAHLAVADQLFRKQRVLGEEDRRYYYRSL